MGSVALKGSFLSLRRLSQGLLIHWSLEARHFLASFIRLEGLPKGLSFDSSFANQHRKWFPHDWSAQERDLIRGSPKDLLQQVNGESRERLIAIASSEL